MQIVTPAKAMAVARAGIARLVAMVQPDGRFIYRYFPDDPSFNNVHYGEVRHVVAVWALVDYEREGLPIEGLSEAIDRAADFMHQRLFRAYGATDTLCVIDEGFVKLGGSAMGVAAELALFERTGDPALVARARATRPVRRVRSVWTTASSSRSASRARCRRRIRSGRPSSPASRCSRWR